MARKSPVSMLPISIQQRALARAALRDIEKKLLPQSARIIDGLDALEARNRALRVSPPFQLARASALALSAHLQQLYGWTVAVASDVDEPVK